jgi:hypothetical protein
LHNLITWWHAQHKAGLDVGLQSFVFKDVSTKGFQYAFAPHVNPNDASTSLVLTEFVEIQRTCASLFGQPYLKVLGGNEQLSPLLLLCVHGS